MTNPNLSGTYANSFEIIDLGNDCYEVRSKVGSAWPQVGDHVFTIDELAFNYTAPDGGVSSQAVAAITTAEPLALAPQKIDVDENPTAGQTIGTISATGGTGTIVYAVGAGSNGAVVISPTGVVTVAGDAFGEVAQPTLFDAEASPSFTVPIQATDDNGTVTETLTVCIVNVNEAPSADDLKVTVIDANTTAGTIITALPTPTDPEGNAVSAQISQGNQGGVFAIVGNDLTTTTTLDSTVTNEYVLLMELVDSEGTNAFYTITVCVQGNNPPTITPGITGAIVASDPAGTAVATATASDIEDGNPASGGTWVITASSLNDLADYVIDSATGAITIAAGATLTAGTDTLTVEYTDTSGLVGTGTIEVEVQPFPPPTISAGNYSIDENQPIGTLVNTLLVNTGGDPSATVTVTHQTGGVLEFAIDNAGNLTTTGVLDFEAFGSHPLTATVTNSVGSDSVNFTVTVNDLNDPPTSVSGGPFSFVASTTAAGASIGTVVAVDPEDGNPATGGTFSITSDPSGLFTINPTTGEITRSNTGTALAGTYVVGVQYADSGTGNLTITGNVSIEATNSLPVVNPGSGTAATDDPAGTTVATATAADPEDGNPATGGTWSITASSLNDLADWEIDPATGVITIAAGATLNAGTDNLTVQYTDTAGDSATNTYTITLTAPNLPPTATDPQTFAIADGSTTGDPAGNVSGMDPELQPLTYSFPVAVPDWDINATTGELTVAAGVTIDQATTPSYSFSVDISDGVNTTTITANITVTAAGPTVSLSQTSSSGSNPGFSVLDLAIITASPPPPTSTLSLVNYSGPGSITPPNSNFQISNVSGTYTLRTAFYSFPPAGVHTFQVQADDGTSTGLSPVYTFTAL